ncbi:MAG TPA: hypothetical protein VFA60_13040 [Terriglobales bacterium]|nr:hypothetical protein [Terriglobales bacterium]
MPNWKKALLVGSFAAGALLALRGYRRASLAAAGVGAAVLASQYPDEIRDLWDRAPELLERGARIAAVVAAIRNRCRDREVEDYEAAMLGA